MSYFNYLPSRVAVLLQNLPGEVLKGVTEVRLRKGLPLSVTVRGKNLLFDRSGRPCGTESAVKTTADDISAMLEKLTGGSLYAFEDQLGNGFLTLPDGCRAGVAGDAVADKNGNRRFREITSVCLRVSRFVPHFADPLTDYFAENGMCGALVLSPPAGGKTTFLKSAAWLLCNGKHPRRVGIADERGELLLPSGLYDRVAGCRKGEAIELLTRTMSPEVIVCDELGVGDEQAVLAAQNTGVALIASVHAGSVEEALRRPAVQGLVSNGVFGVFVLLGAGYEVRLSPPCVGESG